MPERAEDLGRRIRELRTLRGLSQSRLGQPYYTRAMVSAVELGKVGPSVRTLRHFAAQLNVSVDALLEEVPRRQGLSTAEACRSVGALHDLVRLYPDLGEVVRHYSSPHFVPVAMNTCSRPQRADGSLFDDRVVFGLFYVDRTQVDLPASPKLIRQDYLLVPLQAREQIRYYSGEKRSWRRTGGRPIHWRDIRAFCGQDGYAGPGGCYGCSELAPGALVPKHWYRADDPDLPRDPEPVWRLAFELAIAAARLSA